MARIPYSTIAAALVAFASATCPASSADAPLTASVSSASTRVDDQAQAQEGRSLFNQTCAHCHGPDAAAGQPERNLRHLRARYGSDMDDVFRSTVINGRLDKGMPVWAEVLDAKTIDAIYGFLKTVQEDAE